MSQSKSSSSKGFTFSKFNTSTDVVYAVDKNGRVPLALDIAACERWYESDPSLIFADIEIFQEMHRLDPISLIWGIDPSGQKGFKAVLDMMISKMNLSAKTLKAIESMSAQYVGGAE